MGRWLLFLALILTIQLASASIRLNEVEGNPEGSDSGNEWIELYSDEFVNLTGWKIINADGENISLNISFSEYFIINLTGQWLDNTEESVMLINYSNGLIDYSYQFNDSVSGGNNQTWSYCPEGWRFINGTKGAINNCATESQNQTNQTQNTTNQTINNTINQSTNQTAAASLSMKFPKQVYSDEEFEAELNLSNLESSSYDIKVFILNSNGKIISEAYDEENSLWVNPFYYIENFVRGPGNKLESILIRLGEEHRDSEGNFTLYARLRKSGSSGYIESSGRIYVEAGGEYNNTGYINNTGTINDTNFSAGKSSAKPTSKTIYLNYRENMENNNSGNSKDIKSGVLYRSKSQRIRDYPIYGFAALCVLIIAFLLVKRGSKIF